MVISVGCLGLVLISVIRKEDGPARLRSESCPAVSSWLV